MIPREAKRGTSFKGAGMYYLHDKNALTDERVAFTQTENLPTDDPELATRWMAYTALHADELKQQAGVERTGRKASRPVFCFSLSWHPEENPDQEHMVATGRSALTALGLQEHQTVMVAHRDEAYSHLHLMCNLVHPEHGKTHTLQYSRKRLSEWAEAYERENGKIYCEQRVENNRRRKEGEYVKYQDPELDQKAILAKLYQGADNGPALQAALTEAGYTLAQGKRIVLIDREGKLHNLARQLDGVKEKDVRARLEGMTLPDVDEVRKQQEDGRGKQSPPQQANKKEEQEPDEREEQGESQTDTTTAAEPETATGERRISPTALAQLQNRQRDALSQFSWEEASTARTQLWRSLEQQHGKTERRLQDESGLLRQTGQERGRLSEEEAARLATLRHDLAQIEGRKTLATNALDAQLKEREDALKARHAEEWKKVEQGIAPPQTELAAEFGRAAETTPLPPERAVEDLELNAFLDRMEGREGLELSPRFALAAADLRHDGLQQTFAEASVERTPDEIDLHAFLDRMDGFSHEQELAPSSTKVEDEYAYSLRSEFDAVREGEVAPDAGLDAFVDSMDSGPDIGLSLSQE